MRVRLICPIGLALLLALSVHRAAGAEREQRQGVALSVGGYGSFRFEANNAGRVPESFTFRRFVVTTDARIRGRLKVYSEVEYERFTEIEIERKAKAEAGGLEFEQEIEGTNGSELAVEQAWAQFSFTENVAFRMGAVLPPLGRFNIKHDDDLWDLPRRAR